MPVHNRTDRCDLCGGPVAPLGGCHLPTPAPAAFPLDAEQLVRGAGFLITLLRQVLAKDGEAIPSAERLTLDLGSAMGVPLPTRQEAVAITPTGVTVKSGLLPYGAASISAVLDPEAV